MVLIVQNPGIKGGARLRHLTFHNQQITATLANDPEVGRIDEDTFYYNYYS